MKITTWGIVIVIALLGFYVRDWQCQEMFPDANRVACIMWK